MRKSKKLVLTLFITILTVFCISGKVEAAYSASSKTVNSGDSVSITITSTSKLENFDLECIDKGGLTYKSCSTSVVGAYTNTGAGKISYALPGGEATTLGTYTFTAPEVTKQTNYTVKFDVNGETVVSTITVKPKETTPVEPQQPTTPTTPDTPSTPTTPQTPTTPTTPEKPKEKSNNAYLATLGVRIKSDLAEELGVETNAYDFSNFSKTKTTYNVTIPSNVDYLKVEYRAADSNAKVNVTGNSGFEVGSNNKITIKVTAEDGKTTQTYTIKVTQLAEEEQKPGNVIEDGKGVCLTELTLKGIDISPEFAKDTYAYTATLFKEDVTEVEVNAIANKENAKIEISGNTNLVVGENVINIVVTEEESSLQAVYQIVLTKKNTSTPLSNSDTEEISNNENDLLGNIKSYGIIAIVVIVIIIVAIVVLICLLRREENNEEYEVADIDENNNDIEDVEEKNIEIKIEEVRKPRKRQKGKHSM